MRNISDSRAEGLWDLFLRAKAEPKDLFLHAKAIYIIYSPSPQTTKNRPLGLCFMDMPTMRDEKINNSRTPKVIILLLPAAIVKKLMMRISCEQEQPMMQLWQPQVPPKVLLPLPVSARSYKKKVKLEYLCILKGMIGGYKYLWMVVQKGKQFFLNKRIHLAK